MTEEVQVKEEKHEVAPGESADKSPGSSTGEDSGRESESNSISNEFGFDLEHLLKLSIKFFRDNVDKAFHPSYDNRNKLVALSLHAKHGPYTTDKWTPGALDIVGKDRKQAWSDLVNVSKEDAIRSYVNLLDEVCPLYKPYMEAHKREQEYKDQQEREEAEKQHREEEEVAAEARRQEDEARAQIELAQRAEEDQKRAVQEALNRQTYSQFASYAQQQYPSSPEEQSNLIRQLQEQHYQQYMQQMVQHQLRSGQYPQAQPPNGVQRINGEVVQQQQQSNNQISENRTFEVNGQLMGEQKIELSPSNHLIEGQLSNLQLNNQGNDEVSDSEDEVEGTFSPGQMWTRKEIGLFREAITKEGGDGIIKVGHGEIVTVRVPTHPEGSCIFWEFATDSFDIGFGLLFEWTKNPGNQVSVHVSESEDDDDDDEEVSESTSPPGVGGDEDPERGAGASTALERSMTKDDGPPTSVIIPIYRRDSHEEVFAGSHQYPGRGVYLLKFDNSYSLWRSKTLYYRVYYTR